MKFFNKLNPLALVVSFGIGLIIAQYYNPERIVIKYPTPQNAGRVTYKDRADSCYQYKMNKVECPEDPAEIKQFKIQE